MSTMQETTGDAGRSHHEELGPVDTVVIAYPAGAPLSGEAATQLLDLVDRGLVRVLDVLFVVKADDGSYTGFEARDLDDKGVGAFAVFEGVSSGLLGDEDAAVAADALAPGEAAVAIVYENRWAAPFAAAVRRNGGVVVDTQRIPVQALIDAADAAS